MDTAALLAMALSIVSACGGNTSGSGPATIVTLGSVGNEPNGLAVDGKDVYWASVDWQSDAGPSGTGSVQRVSIDGGAVAILGMGVLPYAVAVGATSVYWTENPTYDQSQILRTPRAGGAPSVLFTGGTVTTGLALDDQSNVYWASRQQGSGASLLRMPAAGGNAVVLATSPLGNTLCVSGCIAVDATSVYWVPGPGPLMKVPRAGGAAVSLASTQGATSLAVAPQGVYWMEAAALRRVGIDGGTVTTVAPVAYPAATIAVDSANVYWSDTTDTTILIQKTPLSGGAPTTLATLPIRGLGPPTALAVDETSVYIALTIPGGTLGRAAVQKITPK